MKPSPALPPTYEEIFGIMLRAGASEDSAMKSIREIARAWGGNQIYFAMPKSVERHARNARIVAAGKHGLAAAARKEGISPRHARKILHQGQGSLF